MPNTKSIQGEVADPEELKREWLECLASLVDSIEGWAKEIGWSTRRIEKKLDDSEIGSYQAPALLMQEETTRALLDPIGRSTPGSEGVVDLYLMPAFDDIARLFHRDGEWWLYEASSLTARDEAMEDLKRTLLSRESLQRILESMKKNAG